MSNQAQGQWDYYEQVKLADRSLRALWRDLPEHVAKDHGDLVRDSWVNLRRRIEYLERQLEHYADKGNWGEDLDAHFYLPGMRLEKGRFGRNGYDHARMALGLDP